MDDARPARCDLRYEFEIDSVLADPDLCGGNDDMRAVERGKQHARAIGRDAPEPPPTKIEDHRRSVRAAESDRHPADGAVEGGDVEGQLVADVAQRCGTMAGQRERDTRGY